MITVTTTTIGAMNRRADPLSRVRDLLTCPYPGSVEPGPLCLANLSMRAPAMFSLLTRLTTVPLMRHSRRGPQRDSREPITFPRATTVFRASPRVKSVVLRRAGGTARRHRPAGTWHGQVGRALGAAAVRAQVVLALAWLAVALWPSGLASAQSSDPSDVVSAYETARRSGDTEAMLAVFADNAVIVDRLGYSHTGPDEVRRILRIDNSRGRGLGVTDRRVSGEHVFWVEPAATPLLTVETTVEAVVVGGRITRLVYRSEQGVQAEPPRVGNLLPAFVGMIVPLLVASLSLTALCCVPRPAARAAQPGPGLLGGLQRWSHARRVHLADHPS